MQVRSEEDNVNVALSLPCEGRETVHINSRLKKNKITTFYCAWGSLFFIKRIEMMLYEKDQKIT